jgi:hypothetical protein
MRMRLSLLLSGICLAWAPVAAQNAKPPFIVTISAEAPAEKTGADSYSVKAGSEVYIHVHLVNISKHNLSLGDDEDSRTNIDFYHRYEIRDGAGNPVQKKTFTHPEIGSSGHGWAARILKPGASTDVGTDRITGLYELTRPGTYTIQLSRAVTGNVEDGAVQSNKITVTLTQ